MMFAATNMDQTYDYNSESHSERLSQLIVLHRH